MVEGIVALVVSLMWDCEDCIMGFGCIGSVSDGVGVVVEGVVMVVLGDVGNTLFCVLETGEGRDR